MRKHLRKIKTVQLPWDSPEIHSNDLHQPGVNLWFGCKFNFDVSKPSTLPNF